MRNSHRGAKVLVALLATVGSIMAMAAPASAATVLHTFTIAGHIVTHFDGSTILLNDPVAKPCDVDTGAHPKVVVHSDSVTHATHINGATAYSGFDAGTLTVGGLNFRAVISGAPTTTTGQINTAANTFTQNLSLRVDIRTCDGATSLCTFTVNGHMSGSYTSDATTPPTGTVINAVGAAPITVHIGCNALIRFFILGSTVTANLALTAH